MEELKISKEREVTLNMKEENKRQDEKGPTLAS
jgi:hypothetical protein